MNPLSFIPAAYQVWVRIAVLVVLVGLVFGAGWKVKGAMDGAAIADLKTQHAQLVADATARSLTAQKKADADHQALATSLAQSSATYHEDLTREQHANDLLRADVAAGTRSLRIDATCPGRPADVPQAAASGRMDPGAGAVLSAAAGQAVLDLRARITDTEHQLGACQAAVKCITGQGACAVSSPAGQ